MKHPKATTSSDQTEGSDLGVPNSVQDPPTSGQGISGKIGAGGTIFAILVSFLALGHSVWSDRQSRYCDYLYSQHSRLILLADQIRRISSPYNEMFAQTMVQFERGELTSYEQDERATQMISERISSIDLLEPELNKSKDIIGNRAFDEISAQIEELRQYAQGLNIVELKEDEMVRLHSESDAIVARIVEESASSLDDAGSRLQQNCSS